MNKKTFSGFTINHWKTIKEDKQLNTPVFEIFKRRSRLENEELEGDFYILKPPDWINVIATTPDKKVILVEQFRHGTEESTLEIPGGVVDEGETPLEATKRELLEETGYSSTDWSSLGGVCVNPAIQTNATFFFQAKNCVPQADQNLDRHERIKVHLIPEKEFLELIADGTITHSLVVAAVAKYLLYN